MCEERKRDTVLLTVSFNALDYRDSAYFLSRQEWATRLGIRHICVAEETTGLRLDAHCAAWLRVPIILLLDRYDVLYVDHDCVVRQDCPDPSVMTGGVAGLFIARGHSGRPNSGVMLVSGHASEVLRFCLDHYAEKPPEPCRAPWENGHVIWACQNYPWNPLDRSFNVTRGEAGYIIHHTGPNRSLRTIRYRNDLEGRYDYCAARVTDTAGLMEMGWRVYASSCFDGVRQ